MKKNALIYLIFFLIIISGCQSESQMPVTKNYTNSIGMKFVRLTAGSFLMGQSEGGDWDESPVHKVQITEPFYLAVTEVTNKQFEQFNAEHSELRGKLGFSKLDDEAVVFVSWNDAVDFCKWLTKKEGLDWFSFIGISNK